MATVLRGLSTQPATGTDRDRQVSAERQQVGSLPPPPHTEQTVTGHQQLPAGGTAWRGLLSSEGHGPRVAGERASPTQLCTQGGRPSRDAPGTALDQARLLLSV